MKDSKKNLLTIGEISKISGSSIKALRYYEKIRILNPIYVNEDNNYRYYSYEQINIIHILQLCVELDIPLNKIKQFVGDKKIIDYAGLISYSKEIALSKLSRIQERISFIDRVEKELNLFDSLQDKKVPYHREFDEKLFFTTTYKESADEKYWYDFINSLSDYMSTGDDFFSDIGLSYGSVFQFNNGVINRFLFIETSMKYLSQKLDNSLLIPQGTYLCSLSDNSQINNASEIFKDVIKDSKNFLVIESEVFSRNSNGSLKEIRILVK